MEFFFFLVMVVIVFMIYRVLGGEIKLFYESNLKMFSKWIDI